jgi:hypothetical protein
MSYRKLGEVSNVTGRNWETAIINHGRTKFRSWKNMNKQKQHQSDALSLVTLKCMTVTVRNMRKNNDKR